MPSEQTNQNPNGKEVVSDDEIIKLAYSLVIGTYRFQEMYDMLRLRFDSLEENISPEDADDFVTPAINDFLKLEPHFGHAKTLMESQGKQMDTATHSMTVIDADSHPSALLRQDGRVFYENKAAVEVFGLERGQFLDEELFERGHYKNLIENLQNIDSFDANKIISIFGMANHDSNKMVKVALTKAYGADGTTMGHISAINISWLSSRAKQFQMLFDLTPVELEITKAVVTGVSLNDLAKKRGRSIGTVRNQTKMLLAKLNLHSQTELACLYSGFSEYSGGLSTSLLHNERPNSRAGQHHVIKVDGERVLDYSVVGPERGKPMLYFPALIGGMSVSDKLYEALCKHKIKLIMVWRPGLGDSGLNGDPEQSSYEKFARDATMLLDQLGHDRIPVIGNITGAVFAMAMGKYYPERTSNIICLNGVVPAHAGPHLKLMDKRERMRMFMIRNSPKIGRMVIHAALNLVATGYDQEFTKVHLQDSPIDLASSEDPEIKYLFREDFKHMTKNGFEGFTSELALAARNWSELLDGLAVPVYNIVGEGNVFFTPEVVGCFAENAGNYHVEVIEDAAHFLLHQQPDKVFARINELIAN